MPESAAVTGATTRRAADTTRIEVAVWDLDNVFPSLDRTLRRMTEAQPRFGFRLADLSAPIDAWDMERKARDGTPYLWAERLASRLGRMPLELHVNMLACVTRHWLRDDHETDIYAWWSETGGSPVLIFSVAGFDDLPPEGPETDRALANTLVSGLAGYLSRMDTHKRGPNSCPMAANTKRLLRYIVGRQAFDPACKAKLRKTIPRELAACEALLDAFFR